MACLPPQDNKYKEVAVRYFNALCHYSKTDHCTGKPMTMTVYIKYVLMSAYPSVLSPSNHAVNVSIQILDVFKFSQKLLRRKNL